jgi:hypothetical protein
MDPQKLSQLDPKLREAYQRVMGTTIPEPAAPNQAPAPAPLQPTPPVAQPQPVTNPQAAPEPAIPQQPTSNFVQMNSTVAAIPADQAQSGTVLKKKSGLMPVLFIIAGLIFVGIYTLFWVKIFNLQVPFLQ